MPGRRLNAALLCSLLVHALLLSLSFGAGLGLPGLELPWQTRRAEAPELRVRLEALPAPAPPPALTEPAAAAAEPQAAATASPPDVATTVRMLAPADLPSEPAPLPDAGRALLATPRPDVPWAVDPASAVPRAAVATLSGAASPAVETLRGAGEALRLRDQAAPPAVDARLPTAAVAALSAASGPTVEPLRRAADSLRIRDERRPGVDGALDDARTLPTGTVAALSAASSPGVEPLRRVAEGLRPSAERPGADLARLDQARLEAIQGARQLEAARQAGERQEAARQAAVRQEAARQEAARQEAKRAAAQAEEDAREARLRAIGRQLDEEAARRDAERRRPDWAPARRGRLFGRSDPNEELVLYGEAWARKIQLNAAFETVQEAARQAQTDAIVTVAVRSDGSVESIVFVRSSGVPAVDDAIRRLVQAQERYPAFPPALLRDFDVVEIRRSWHFDTAVRLY